MKDPRGKRKATVNGHGGSHRPVKVQKTEEPAVGITRVPTGPTLEPTARTGSQKLLKEIEERFKQAADLFSAINRPLPLDTGNGTYVEDKKEKDLWRAMKKFRPKDFLAIANVLHLEINGEAWNDREYQLEYLLQAVITIDQDSRAGKMAKQALLHKLWNDVPHPPTAYLGKVIPSSIPVSLADGQKEHYVNYRMADGSYNNIENPKLGAASMPYARTVKPKTMSKGALPDPGVLFDTLMARKYNQRHQNKISSMLFYLASIIIHDLFRTDHVDFNISNTSSYLDLSPLYGNDIHEQKLMRTFEDGKIKPDCFSEKRLLGFPPGVGAILIMFNRFHNHVVENLASINEGGRFTKPATANGHSAHHQNPHAKTWRQYDEDLFQTGRLITCGLYINIILFDYIRTILNLNREDTQWVFDPRMDTPDLPAGVGNQVSAEFNLIYRWHSTLSERDTAYTENLYDKITKGRSPKDVSTYELLGLLREWESNIPADPSQRDLGDLKRDPKTHMFSDDDLVSLLVESIEDCAHSFGPRRVPEVLRSVEILGIKQARQWNLATLNEFRTHFGLSKYTKFEQVTTDTEVQASLRHLYDTPDNIELYPGLVVEDAKESFRPGSGLMGPFSITRGILSDAVALVRGDRFYTTDFTPKNLTNWGFCEANGDPIINNGHVMYKLFMVSFPLHFQYNSIYAHWPLTIPSENKLIFDGLEKSHLYTWDRPKATQKPKIIKSYDACIGVLKDQEKFKVPWGKNMVFLMGEDAEDFMLAGDSKTNKSSRDMMRQAVYIPQWEQEVRDFYRSTSAHILKRNKYQLNGVNHIDVIRDFSNIIHTRFCAEMFKVPLKTEEHPHGIFTENELYLILVGVFILVFFDVDKENSFRIHTLAKDFTRKLGKVMEKQVDNVRDEGIFATGLAWVKDVGEVFFQKTEANSLEKYGRHMIERLASMSNMPTRQLVWGHILGTLGGMVPNQSQGFAEMLEWFLNGAGKRYWPEIVKLANQPDSTENNEKLARYVMEGTRIACASLLKRDVAVNTTVKDEGKDIELHEGDSVLLNLFAASHDPKVFPDPEDIKLDRPMEAYCQFGFGPHQCLGLDLLKVSLSEALRTIARLPNVRPVAGPQGEVKKLPSELKEYSRYMTEEWNSFWPFPVTMKICWDSDDEEDSEEYTANGAGEADSADEDDMEED